MSTPHLLSLPAEIRLNIYSHLFAEECLYLDPATGTSRLRAKQHCQPALPPILRTCRYLRDEASPSYFSKVKVHFNVRTGLPSTNLIHWLDNIGEPNVKLLRNFNMRWEDYVDISLVLTRNAHVVSKRTFAGFEEPSLEAQRQENNLTSGGELLSLPKVAHLPFKTSLPNPTTSTRIGRNHILTMKGVSGSGDREHYWRANGTAEFCDTLTRYLSERIGATLENRGLYMTARELVEFIEDASNHSSSMRWLWYW